jgi:hypothetical protein
VLFGRIMLQRPWNDTNIINSVKVISLSIGGVHFNLTTHISAFHLAVALDIQGKIQWTEACVGMYLQCNIGCSLYHLVTIAGPDELGPAKVVLDDARLSGGVMQDGRFVMFVPN